MAITRKDAPNTQAEIEAVLTPTVKKWFFSRFKSFSLPQLYGVLEIHNRTNVLVSAPTGATKTLTGFLSVLNELVDLAEKGILEDRVYCIYVSPLKALSNDISKNLKEPLEEIEKIAGKNLGIRVGVRTGDTTASQKSGMLLRPPHILITTPESLAIVLSSIKFKKHLEKVDWCIIDEIHALAENKRGVHLCLTIERLEAMTGHICRVGLSATVSPLEEVAKYLVGNERDCKLIDIQFTKNLDLKVLSPVDNLIDTNYETVHKALYALIDELVSAHKTTLVFTNTRSATERVVDHLKSKFPSKYVGNIGAHHGSMSKAMRLSIEDRLRKGELKCVVCSTSLELGIDIGYIDLVLCLGSPKSVARFLQRAGRSGHKLHETVKARILVMDRDDLVECAVLMKSAIDRKIDTLHIPTNALDVLSQHIIGIALEKIWGEEEIYELVKRTYCYSTLNRKDFNSILSYLAGEFALEDRHIYAKIWRQDGKIGKRGKMTRVIYMTNLGTIPDESFITVKVGTETVGMLDEGFVERLKPGDVFVLGGETYIFKFSRGMVAQVLTSVNRPPTVPNWVSEMLPLSFDLANEIGRFRKLMFERFLSKKSRVEIISFVNSHLLVDEKAASAIYEYFKEQYDYCSLIPNNNLIVVEHYSDGKEKKIIFHTLFGRRVNDCLSRAVAFVISKTIHKDVEIGISDNGFFISGDKNLKPVHSLKLLTPEKLEMLMKIAIEKSEVFKRRFRHCATRSFMILRNYLGHQKNVGRQQVSSMILMSALKRIDDNFSILSEARRECLEDLMDIGNTKKVIAGIQTGIIAVKEIDTNVPSPFALNLALMGYLDVLRMEDRYEFLRRMHENIIAKISGKPVTEIRSSEFISGRETLKEQLKKEAKSVTLSLPLKAELFRVVSGIRKNIDSKFIDYVHKNKDEIDKTWPQELRSFVLSVCDDLIPTEFSYEHFWNLQSDAEKQKNEDLVLELLIQFNTAADRERLPALIRQDIYRLIEGEDRVSEDTLTWLTEFASKPVKSYWKDEIAKFLVKKWKKIK